MEYCQFGRKKVENTGKRVKEKYYQGGGGGLRLRGDTTMPRDSHNLGPDPQTLVQQSTLGYWSISQIDLTYVVIIAVSNTLHPWYPVPESTFIRRR